MALMRKKIYSGSKSAVVCVATALGLLILPGYASSSVITQVSVATDGTKANGSWGIVSERPAVSADGRVIVFSTDATNLDDLADNGVSDLFVHAWDDGGNRTTTRVSIGRDAEGGPTPGDDKSEHPGISADGSVVVFASRASNLVEGDTNDTWDVFVHYRDSKTTERVSVPDPSKPDTEANGASGAPAISADGNYVAFVSAATNLVADAPDSGSHVYVRNLSSGATRYIGPTGVYYDSSDRFSSNSVAISAAGEYVAFVSRASASVNDRIHHYDVQNDELTVIPCPACGGNNYIDRSTVSMSDDGNFVVFGILHGFNSAIGILYLYDHEDGTVREVGRNAQDGRYTYDQGNISPALSPDGNYLVFTAYSDEYVIDGWEDQDSLTFVEHLTTGETQCVSVTADGTPWPGYSVSNALSADGGYVVFGSRNAWLVEGGNWRYDLYRHDRINGPGCVVPVEREDEGGTVIIIGDTDSDGAAAGSGSGGGGGATGLAGLLGFMLLLARRRASLNATAS